MSASQMLIAPIYYTTLAVNDALPDPTFCNQCKPWKPVALNVGAGAGKLLGVRRILPKFPQTCLKKLLRKWS